MYRVSLPERDYNEYFNKKENAVKRAKELFTKCIYNDYWTGSIEKYNEEYGNYEEVMAEIETGNFFDEWVTIEEIKTED